jgi:hypothetical protein
VQRLQRHRLRARDRIDAALGIVESPQDFLNRVLPLLQRSDPIPKLLPQVRLGRMPKDSPALLAIISSWMEAFVTVLKEGESVLDVNGVLRLDPRPRLAVLHEAGLLDDNDANAQAARSAYSAALKSATERAGVTA